MTEPDEAPRRLGAFALLLGLFSATWAVVTWLPTEVPAWPAASAGLVGLALARYPGHALFRGLGAVLCLGGALGGLAKIAALWGIAELVQ